MTRKHAEIEKDDGTLVFEGGIAHDEGKAEPAQDKTARMPGSVLRISPGQRFAFQLRHHRQQGIFDLLTYTQKFRSLPHLPDLLIDDRKTAHLVGSRLFGIIGHVSAPNVLEHLADKLPQGPLLV